MIVSSMIAWDGDHPVFVFFVFIIRVVIVVFLSIEEIDSVLSL